MEATYAEYEEWSEKGVAETVVHLYKKAVEQLDKYKPLEEMLVKHLLLTSHGPCSCRTSSRSACDAM